MGTLAQWARVVWGQETEAWTLLNRGHQGQSGSLPWLISVKTVSGCGRRRVPVTAVDLPGKGGVVEPLPPLLAGDPSLPRARQQLTTVQGSPAGRSRGGAPSQWPCGEPQRALDSVTVLGSGLGFLACLLMALASHKDSWSLLICKAEDELSII